MHKVKQILRSNILTFVSRSVITMSCTVQKYLVSILLKLFLSLSWLQK